MWPRVFVDGEEYDVWALRGMHQVFDEWLLRETGPVCTTIGVKNHWEMMEDGRNVLDEWVWVRAFKSGTYGRALDIRLTLPPSTSRGGKPTTKDTVASRCDSHRARRQ